MFRRLTQIELGLTLLFAFLDATVDFTSLQMSMSIKRKCGVSILSVLVLPSRYLYLYKHTHADMLTPHYSKSTVNQQHLQPT